MSRYFFDDRLNRDSEQRFSKRSTKSGRSTPPEPPPVDYIEEFRDRANSEKKETKEERNHENLGELENRRRYVASVLEKYYSHPSNRNNSMPSTLRKQLVENLAVSTSEKERRKEMNGELYVDDSVSDVSYVVRSAGATPDPSFYDDDDEDAYSATFGANYGETKKGKSRFFRSSSIRSLKKLVSKLRGGGGSMRPRSRPASTDPSFFTGVFAPSQDSGLETPSDSSVNYNANNLQIRSHSPAENGNHGLQARILNGNIDIPTPGLCGITNHGNTCYINAVIQCLSNTDLLAEYFLSGRYLTDLNNNLRNADRYGSQGNVTVHLAEFLKALWFNKYTPDVSLSFKRMVERYSEQYRGNQQQDAQEFFYWLSDRVHEDLNVAVKRRYKLHKSRSKDEDELATAAMEKHLEAHNSFVSARFHGLFLSSITCSVCSKQSTKPDPFMCISLPVSQSTKRPLFVVIVFLNRQPRQMRYGLNADVTATFQEVKKCMADATGLNAENMVLCEISDRGFQTTLHDQSEVINLGDTKCIWAFETPPIYGASRDEELVLLAGNQSNGNGSRHRFGTFVALKVHREVSYGDLCRSILLALRPQLKPNLSIQDIPLGAFRIRLADDYRPYAYVAQDVALPLYTQAVDNALMDSSNSTSTVHLKMMVEWQRSARESYFSSNEERIVDHRSAQDLHDQEKHPEIQGLRDCLTEYTRAELCQWYCPNCHRHQDDAVKRIVLYWLPDILVLHLKRFKRQSTGQLVKLDSTVWFPTRDLDLSDFMHQSINRNHNHRSSGRRRIPSNSNYRVPNGELYVDMAQNENLYDLYAVCNHSGYSPHSGHYTAYCRNPVNGRWYCFDDQSVTPMHERDLVTNAAYLLFYARRQTRKDVGGQHSSTESGFVDHWYFKLLSDRERQRSSGSTKGTSDGLESNVSSTASRRKSAPKIVNAPAPDVPPTPPRSFSQSKLFVKLPGSDELKNGIDPPDQNNNGTPRAIRHAGNSERSSNRSRDVQLDNAKKIPVPTSIKTSPRILKLNWKRNDPVDDQKPLLPAEENRNFDQPNVVSPKNIARRVKEEKANDIEKDFLNFKSIPLPSCAKILTTGVAAPISITNGGSPALSSTASSKITSMSKSSSNSMVIGQFRTHSAVETDL